MNSKSHRDTSINTALGVLGETVAQIVFIPVISTALHYKDASLKEKNKKFIWQEMKEWGYSSEYIDDFLAREWKKPLGNLMDQIDALDKILKGKFRRKRGRAGRVFANDVNKKDLCHKSMDLCQNLYTRNGIVDSEIKCYLDQLKYKMKV
ncbi:MAG: hypothetical protein LBP19_04815 [Treponema sp.]|nr:hypothetical protein [Treponema sp.]